MPATQALGLAFSGMFYVAASCPKSPRIGCICSVAPTSVAGNYQNVTTLGVRGCLVARRIVDTAAGDANPLVDMMDERHEAVSLQRKREIGEDGPLDGRRKCYERGRD